MPAIMRALKRLLYCVLWFSGLLSSRSWGQPDLLPPTPFGLSGSLPQPELITDRQGLPQSFIPSIVQDQQGFIWMATRDGLARYDGQHFKVFQPQAGPRPSLSFAGIRQLSLDQHGWLWILSEQGDIDRFDPRTETFVNLSRQPHYRRLVGQAVIARMLIDNRDRLWLALEREVGGSSLPNVPLGLVCLHIATRQTHRFHFKDQLGKSSEAFFRDMCQDDRGTIWAVTGNNCLHRFEERRGRFTTLDLVASNRQAFRNGIIMALYAGPQGELLMSNRRDFFVYRPAHHTLIRYALPDDADDAWGIRLARDPEGKVYFTHHNRLFRYQSGQPPRILTQYSIAPGRSMSIGVDHSGVLWMGTDGIGIRKYDLRAYPFQTAPYQTHFHTDLLSRWLGIPAPVVRELGAADPYQFRYTLDHTGGVWANVGTSLFFRLKPTTRQCQTVRFPIPFEGYVTPLATDPTGRIWTLVKLNQFWSYNERRQQWQRSELTLDENRTGIVLQLVADEAAFWLATETNGLFRLDRRTGQLRQYAHQPTNATSLSSNALLCLSGDPADVNRLWIGTFGSGLCVFDKRTGTSQHLTAQNGLPNNVVYSALPDAQGYVWMGTNKGLCRMHRTSFQVRVYTRQDGILADEFNRFHYLQLPDNRIIMAGLEGFTAFYPNQLGNDRFAPSVELTSLELNNKRVTADSTSPLGTLPIQAARQITLPYDQNFVTIGFSALQFNRPRANRYRYRLAGINSDWVESDRPEAVYTALPPGGYELAVNASNTSGQWSPSIRRLSIRVLPPWWRTGWAYLLYGLTLVGIGWYGFRQYMNRLRLQQTVVLRQQEARQLRVIDEMKSRFFANITHEFRTPLTLILSPAQRLKASLEQPQHHRWITGIERNAHQLLQLINQLMDLAKADAQALKVEESRGLPGEFVSHLLQPFAEQAEAGQISWHVQSEVTGEYWFDADKLERIVTNLVANALKFTPPGGAVQVTLSAGEGIGLTVADTGVGLAAHELPHIFDRFYQVSNPASQPGHDRSDGAGSPSAGDSVMGRPAGTGIGLALVKELVALLQGRIEVNSQPGSGTVFTVYLPFRPVAESVPVQEPPMGAPAIDPAQKRQDLPRIADYQPAVLLVEDNDELASFIADSLPQHYRISRAANGAEGLELAFAQVPDLVISDVMMPIMDGYALCQRLKDDGRTNHIPLILLTAKAAHASRMEGLSRGADDYLTKPFHIDELRLRVYNLLLRQERLRHWVRQSLTQVREPSAAPSPPDPFVAQVYNVLDSVLDQSDFSVDQLADALAVSVRTLHRKLSALTGMSANELLRSYRLRQAARLLAQGQPVSEVAYRVGFETLSYFSKCFKEQFGQSPSDFASSSFSQ